MPAIKPCSNCGKSQWQVNTNKNVIIGFLEGEIANTGAPRNQGIKTQIYICKNCNNMLFIWDNN